MMQSLCLSLYCSLLLIAASPVVMELAGVQPEKETCNWKKVFHLAAQGFLGFLRHDLASKGCSRSRFLFGAKVGRKAPERTKKYTEEITK